MWLPGFVNPCCLFLYYKNCVKLKVNFTLEQATKAQRWSRGIAPLFFKFGVRWGEWSTPRPGRFSPGKDTVPIVQVALWAPGPVWTGVENFAPTGIRSSDRPALSESLYRPHYPGATKMCSPNNMYTYNIHRMYLLFSATPLIFTR